AHFDALVSHELQTGAPMLSPTPIPKDAAAHAQPRADAGVHSRGLRLRRGSALPLTRLAQRAGTATAVASRIHHAQTAIGALFAAPGHEAPGLLDSGGSHRAGEESL